MRIGSLSTLALCCLFVAGLQGCSGDNKTANDAGGVTDAGPKDGGPKDGGPVTAGGEIGENCINNNSGTIEQSTCATGLLCLPLSQENSTLTVCTKECTANAECGVGANGIANFCWSGLCWQGCATANGTCNQGDFSCQQGFVQGSGLCTPDCSLQAKSFCSEFFGYPFDTCDTGTQDAQGSCGTAGGNLSCGPTMACAGSDEACYAIPPRSGSTTSPGSVCVADCTTVTSTTCRNNTECASDSCVSGHCAACQRGLACDSTGATTAGTCQIVPEPNYGLCFLTSQCPTNVSCIPFDQAGNGECLPTCTTNTDCPAAGTGTTAKCVDIGSKFCFLDCAAAGSVCPPDTACANFGGTIGSICAPLAGANHPDGGPADAGTTPDSGTTPDDAGTTPDDAGTTPVDEDGGTTDDAGTN